MTPRRSAAVMIAVAAVLCPLMLAAAGRAAAGTQMPANAAAVAGTWGTAQKVPGAIALNSGGRAQVASISCTSAGNCSAGGSYTDRSGHHQAFVVSQVNGTWRTAIPVPGAISLNKGGNADIFSVSCASAGNCSAGGYYTTDASAHTEAFLVSQVKGSWRTAIKVPGTAALNLQGNAEVNSVSCPSAGNCTAGGYYKDGSFRYQAFVVSEVNGTWRTAKELSGSSALNKGGNAGVTSVSCVSAGNCSAGGSYVGSSPGSLPFVASEVNGTWRTARAVPGADALTKGGALVTSVSCRTSGNCSAGGSYQDGSGRFQAFVVNQVDGTWRTIREVPGTATLNTGGNAYVYSVSCGSAGNCSAVGSFFTSYLHAFVANEVNGVWRTAIEVPGTAALNLGKTAYVNSVSCASAGNCTAGGTYTDSAKHMQAFVVSEVNGTWGTATQLAGTGALNSGGSAFVQSVSCTAAGKCGAAGGYTGTSGNRQAFVATQG
jgi:hypothetical protein